VRNGLQSRLRRFDSDPSLQSSPLASRVSNAVEMPRPTLDGWQKPPGYGQQAAQAGLSLLRYEEDAQRAETLCSAAFGMKRARASAEPPLERYALFLFERLELFHVRQILLTTACTLVCDQIF